LTARNGIVTNAGRIVCQATKVKSVRPNRILPRLIGLLLACSIGLGPAALRAQTLDPATAANAAKLSRLLKETGLTYNTHSGTTWSVDLQRKNIGKVRVITSVGSVVVVTFAILAKKAAIQKTMQLLDALASANHEYDYAKIGLDKDGDLFVRIDTPSRLIDAKELKSAIDQVANASDEVFAKVSGSIRH
jgi:hypothetical protein